MSLPTLSEVAGVAGQVFTGRFWRQLFSEPLTAVRQHPYLSAGSGAAGAAAVPAAVYGVPVVLGAAGTAAGYVGSAASSLWGGAASLFRGAAATVAGATWPIRHPVASAVGAGAYSILGDVAHNLTLPRPAPTIQFFSAPGGRSGAFTPGGGGSLSPAQIQTLFARR